MKFIQDHQLGLLLLAAAITPAAHSIGNDPENKEKPGMLERVDRRPGILFPPSDLPTGDQAGIYMDLLETDPENTSFEREWLDSETN